MTKRFSFSSGLVVGILMFTVFMSSCKPYRKVIPTDALVVVEVDVLELGMKSNILEQKDDISRFIASIDPENQFFQKLSNSIKKPRPSGIRMTQPVYFFVPSNGQDMFFTAAVRRKGKVISTFQSFSKDIRIEETEHITWLFLKDKLIGAVTKKTLLLGSARNKDVYHRLLTQKKGFFDTDASNVMARNRGDVTTMVNLQHLSSDAKEVAEFAIEMIDSEEGDVNKTLKQLLNAQIVMSLKFESGHIAFNTRISGINNEPFFTKKIQPEDLQSIPNDHLLCVLALGTYQENIQKAYGDLHTQLQTAINDYALIQLPQDCQMHGEGNYCYFTHTSADAPTSSSFQKAQNAASCYAYAYFDKAMINRLASNKEEVNKIKTSILQVVDYAELKMKKGNQVSLLLHFTDKSQNALALIIKQIINNL